MEFPITERLDTEASEAWLIRHFTRQDFAAQIVEQDVNKRIGFGEPSIANCKRIGAVNVARRTTCTVVPSLPNVI